MISLLYKSIITVFKGKKEETPTENKKGQTPLPAYPPLVANKG
jgi:hypothetical protein